MAHYLVKQFFTDMPAADVAGVKVNGWVRTMRESKTFAFVELNDGTYFKNLQIILEADKLPNYRRSPGPSAWARPSRPRARWC